MLLPLVIALACAPNDPPALPAPAAAATSEKLGFPILERELIAAPVMGFDHDPMEYEGIDDMICTSYSGEAYPHCYDGHDGSDFDLVGGFDTMDAGSAVVVSATSGTVETVVDEHYDRCHLDLETLGPDCDGHPIKSNKVVVRTSDGTTLAYLHLMQDSASVAVGEAVERGTPLGLVGSSGWSTAPHLHLEVVDSDGITRDPYAGPHSQPESWWCDQGEQSGLPGDCGEPD